MGSVSATYQLISAERFFGSDAAFVNTNRPQSSKWLDEKALQTSPPNLPRRPRPYALWPFSLSLLRTTSGEIPKHSTFVLLFFLSPKIAPIVSFSIIICGENIGVFISEEATLFIPSLWIDSCSGRVGTCV